MLLALAGGCGEAGTPFGGRCWLWQELGIPLAVAWSRGCGDGAVPWPWDTFVPLQGGQRLDSEI